MYQLMEMFVMLLSHSLQALFCITNVSSLAAKNFFNGGEFQLNCRAQSFPNDPIAAVVNLPSRGRKVRTAKEFQYNRAQQPKDTSSLSICYSGFSLNKMLSKLFFLSCHTFSGYTCCPTTIS